MKVDQCLFGYEDGHRLLASSIPLGEEISLLTELSDVAPGAVFGDSDGYWTGLPVASLGRYVLMRTWPAPEMTRPGCVWTHALLIDPLFLETIDDLSMLQFAVVRPSGTECISEYRKTFDLTRTQSSTSLNVTDDKLVLSLLSALYETMSSPVEILRPGELDTALFAVWSQQWPKLRRTFRFQTAASRTRKPTIPVRFDVTALLVLARNYSSHETDINRPAWLTAAVNDIRKGNAGALRAFLWRYGQDTRRQRGSFRPLTEIHRLNSSTEPPMVEYLSRLIYNAFPDARDARCLKQDLVDGLLVPAIQTKLLLTVLSDDNQASNLMPLPSSVGLEKLVDTWPSEPNDFLALIEITERDDDPQILNLHQTLLRAACTPDFWKLSNAHPAVQSLMVRYRSNLLFTAKVLPNDERLADLICHIPVNAEGLEQFISSLLVKHNHRLIDNTFQHFPDLTASIVIDGFSDGVILGSSPWLMSLWQYPHLLLNDTILGRVPRTRILFNIAARLGWFTQDVMKAGISPWLCALLKSENDLQGEDMEALACFLLVLACYSGDEEGLNIIEIFYNAIHKKIMDAELSSHAAELLYPHLPEVDWFRNWDVGFRFRLLIAEAFVKHQWPYERFKSLGRGKKGRILLAKAVSEVIGGEVYLDANEY